MTDPTLIDLLAPSAAGRIETLSGLPLAAIAAGIDDGTATVATLTAVVAGMHGHDVAAVIEAHPTVHALRTAAVTHLTAAVEAVLSAVQAGPEDTDG